MAVIRRASYPYPRSWNRRQVPNFPVTVDRTHPRANGLVGFWIPGDDVRDLTGNASAGVLTNSPTYATSPYGASMSFSGTAYLDVVRPNDADVTGALSIVSLVNMTSGSTYHEFAFKSTSNGGVNCPFDFRTDNSATPNLVLIRSTSANNSTWTGPAVSLNTWHSVGVTCPDVNVASAPTFYLDGSSSAASAGVIGNGNVSGNGADLLIGRRADGAVQLIGGMAMLGIWNRALTAAEILAMHLEPFALLRPTQRRFYTVGGPTTFTQTLTASNSSVASRIMSAGLIRAASTTPTKNRIMQVGVIRTANNSVSAILKSRAITAIRQANNAASAIAIKAVTRTALIASNAATAIATKSYSHTYLATTAATALRILSANLTKLRTTAPISSRIMSVTANRAATTAAIALTTRLATAIRTANNASSAIRAAMPIAVIRLANNSAIANRIIALTKIAYIASNAAAAIRITTTNLTRIASNSASAILSSRTVTATRQATNNAVAILSTRAITATRQATNAAIVLAYKAMTPTAKTATNAALATRILSLNLTKQASSSLTTSLLRNTTILKLASNAISASKLLSAALVRAASTSPSAASVRAFVIARLASTSPTAIRLLIASVTKSSINLVTGIIIRTTNVVRIAGNSAVGVVSYARTTRSTQLASVAVTALVVKAANIVRVSNAATVTGRVLALSVLRSANAGAATLVVRAANIIRTAQTQARAGIIRAIAYTRVASSGPIANTLHGVAKALTANVGTVSAFAHTNAKIFTATATITGSLGIRALGIIRIAQTQAQAIRGQTTISALHIVSNNATAILTKGLVQKFIANVYVGALQLNSFVIVQRVVAVVNATAQRTVGVLHTAQSLVTTNIIRRIGTTRMVQNAPIVVVQRVIYTARTATVNASAQITRFISISCTAIMLTSAVVLRGFLYSALVTGNVVANAIIQLLRGIPPVISSGRTVTAISLVRSAAAVLSTRQIAVMPISRTIAAALPTRLAVASVPQIRTVVAGTGMKVFAPIRVGDTDYAVFDFSPVFNSFATGYPMFTSEPAGFTFVVRALQGTVVTVSMTAPTVPGNYILFATATDGSPRVITIDASILVVDST